MDATLAPTWKRVVRMTSKFACQTAYAAIVGPAVNNPLLVDSREPDDMVPWLLQLGVPAERKQLAVADYRFRDRDGALVLVSRKAGDLLDSVFSGHFADELHRCLTLIESSGGGKLVYLQEGLWEANTGAARGLTRTGYQQSSDTAASVPAATQVSLQSAGLMFLATNSPWGSAVALAALYDRAQRGWPSKLMMSLPRPELRWTQDDDFRRVARLMALWPRLSEQQAVAILERWGSIAHIMYAATDDPSPLYEIKGVGPKLLDNFRKVVL